MYSYIYIYNNNNFILKKIWNIEINMIYTLLHKLYVKYVYYIFAYWLIWISFGLECVKRERNEVEITYCN